MTDLWWWILAACAIAYATKLAGYLVPDSLLDRPRVTTVSAGMTVGLLTSLVVVNTFVTGTSVVVDARLAALAAAAVALWLRAPYLVVVLVGAVAAALTRLAAKGRVRPAEGGRPRRFRAAVTREAHTAELLRDLLGSAPDREAVLAAFVGGISETDSAALRRLLD